MCDSVTSALVMRAISSMALIVLTVPVLAAESAAPPALSPSEASADFAFQGEYSGNVEINGSDIRYGAQIIALGEGKFHGVGYPGGLPGDGYYGAGKLEGDAELKDGAVVFGDEEAVATVEDGAITIATKGGTRLGVLKKVRRESPTLGAKPPAGAVVLFDGKSVEHFPGAKISEEGLLIPPATSHLLFQNCSLHLEFLLPFMPEARGQARANSGCYLQGRYEVQILDSFGLAGQNNECGGIYGLRSPLANMCFPPLSWQTYDIDYTAAKFDAAGKKIADARMTVRQNGALIHKEIAVPKTTTAAPLSEGSDPGPLYLQDHGNPVRFRNIWLVEKP